MLLKTITIQGFKSFPDKTALSFGKGITAVIGPNGSGKSNISDAVRWVLGEQSTKSLRGQKMEDVVFGGTAARRPLGFAEVSITIDNSEKRLPFDNDTVTVTRRYYRSGESEYLINNTTVRLKDIHELFMDTGLGRDGYSMIGQGKIDTIVASKSEDRRDIFEEAAGISRYRYRKEESERKLCAAEENLLRLKDIFSELESRIEPLAEQSEKAKKFLEYSAEKRELEIGLWLNALSKSKDKLREQDYKITLSNNRYKEIENELDDIESEIDEITQKSQQITINIDEIRRKAAEAEEEAARIDGEIAVLKNTIFHNNETIDRIGRDIEQSKADDLSIDNDIKAKTELISEKKDYITEKNKNLNEVTDELNNLLNKNSDYSTQIEERTKELNELSAKSSDERVKIVTAKSASDELTVRNNAVEENLNSNLAKQEELNTELSAILTDLQRAEEQISECSNVLKGYEILHKSRQEKTEALKSQFNKLQLDIGEKQRRAAIIEDLEKNMEGFSFAVKSVTNQSKQGLLSGIHGPISRLIKVPSEYSAAIETALGAAIQNVVVETEENAKKAITYLKNSNGGRATFLPISSVKGNLLTEKGLEDCSGFIGIAATLIKYDSKYNGIILSILGRVAVCDDMDSAISIARKYGYRFKIVTLDGQVVNAGGSMTGGSTSKNAGILSRANDIEKYKKEAVELQKKADEITGKIKSAAAELSSVEADTVAAKSELITANEDKIRLLGEERRIKEQLEILVNQNKALSDEKEKTAERLNLLTIQIREAEEETEKLQSLAAEKEKELEAIIGGRDELTGRREALSEKASELKLDMFTAEKDIETFQNTITELELSKENKAEKLASLISETDEIKLKNKDAESSIEELKNKKENLSNNFGGAEQEILELNNKRNEADQRSVVLRTLEREKMSEREKVSGETARLEERKSSMMKEYDEIISKLYDEYELTLEEAENLGIKVEEPAKAQKRLNEIKNKIKQLGSVNVSAIEEYKEVSERYEFLKTQIADIEKSRDELRKLISDLTVQMKEVFAEQFIKIGSHFSATFKELFGGGTAELRLTDSQNVLESGIEIIVQPPGKNISIIEQLSGGEKALIAVAIYFAIMKVNPPPFCLLDEVEAALDEVNVDRFAEYLRKMSVNTQFIIITHRRGTMEEADILYGVTMQEKGVSKLLQLDVSEIEKTLQV